MLCPRDWCGQCWWEQSPGSSTALLPQDWNMWQCCCPGAGLGLGRTLSAFVLTRPAKQSGSYWCWQIKQLCKQSGRAFTFTPVFPVCSMPKCRTWKSAYGEGEMCIYSIKSGLYGEICDVNSSITVLMYLMWCDSAEGTALLDWFILAESLTQSEFCLLLFCWLRMNLNKIHLLSF